MKVTNEQAQAILTRKERVLCFDLSSGAMVWDDDLASDLLEARAENADALAVLNDLLVKPFDTNCDCKECNRNKDNARAAIVKTEGK